MLRFVALVLSGLLALSATDALAAQPVKGGHYVYTRDLGKDVFGGGHYYVEVELTLANDGREFARPSGVFENVRCGSGSGVIDGLALDGAVEDPYLATPIRMGRFSGRGRGIRRFAIRGHFARGGTVAAGTVAIRGGNAACPSIRLSFRAPLVGRPNAPHPGRRTVCDRVVIRQVRLLSDQDEAYRVYDQGVGCTNAREIARQWRASDSCQRLTTGDVCALGAARCRAVPGGRFNGLVSAQCTTATAPGGLVELVHYVPCRPPAANPDEDITMWAVNLGCDVARTFPVHDLIGDPESDTGPCGEIYSLTFKSIRCAPVAGYLCRARNADFGPEPGFYAVCVQAHDGFRALVLYDEV